MTDFDGVSGRFEALQILRDSDGEILHRVVAIFVINSRWPDPSNREWRFSPAFGDGSVITLHRDFGSGAGNRIENLISEFQGNPHRDGDKVESNRANAADLGGHDSGWFSGRC